jgi:hypothetical protein
MVAENVEPEPMLDQLQVTVEPLGVHEPPPVVDEETKVDDAGMFTISCGFVACEVL